MRCQLPFVAPVTHHAVAKPATGPVEISRELLKHVAGGSPKGGWGADSMSSPKGGWAEAQSGSPKGGWL